MKNLLSMPGRTRKLNRGAALDFREFQGRLWTLNHGAVLIERLTDAGETGLRLALPGDWIGVEDFCGLPPSTGLSALMDCRLSVFSTAQVPPMSEMVIHLLHQHQRSADHLLALRTGSVAQRLEVLLGIVRTGSQKPLLQWRAEDLPALRHIALLLDIAPETACRSLAQMRATPTAHPAPRQTRLAQA